MTKLWNWYISGSCIPGWQRYRINKRTTHWI